MATIVAMGVGYPGAVRERLPTALTAALIVLLLLIAYVYLFVMRVA